jgi:hypothetical protein
LDQFDLSIILQKIEEYQKTGLLIVKQGEATVELFVQQGQLMCIGPVRPGISLGERLSQAGVISPEACRAVEGSLGDLSHSESDAAHAFINAGCVGRESLSRWASAEASRVLKTILTWEDGELYFEEDQAPPAHRLFVALSMASLLPAALASHVPSSSPGPTISEASPQTWIDSPGDNERHTDRISPDALVALRQPQRITDPISPIRVDTSYIQPHMVLVPADLSAYRESNTQVLITPEQWRLFTRANGETTLVAAAQELSMAPDQVRRVAGELQALGLVTLLSPVVPGLKIGQRMGENARAGASYGHMTGGAPAASPPVATLPYHSAGQPIETQSQWGNGGSGATFQPGVGWVVAHTLPQHTQQDDQAPRHTQAFAETR